MTDRLLRRTVLLLVVAVLAWNGVHALHSRPRPTYPLQRPSAADRLAIDAAATVLVGLFVLGVLARLGLAMRSRDPRRDNEERRARRTVRALAEEIPPYDRPHAESPDPDPALDEADS